MFTTREAAIAAWMCLFVAWAVAQAGLRASFDLIRSALHWKILLPVILMAAYTAAVVWGLYSVGAWTFDLIKDTIFWFVFSGMAITFSMVLETANTNMWRRLVLDQLKVVVVLEYIVNTYTFSFLAELALVPFLTLLAMLDVITRSDAKHAHAAKLTRGLQGLFGLGILVCAITQAVKEFEAAQSVGAFRSVLLPPILSLLFLPFAYILILVTTYDSLLVNLKLGPPKDEGIEWYAKRRLICHLGLRLQMLRNFMQAHARNLTRIKTKADIDSLLARDETDRKQ